MHLCQVDEVLRKTCQRILDCFLQAKFETTSTPGGSMMEHQFIMTLEHLGHSPDLSPLDCWVFCYNKEGRPMPQVS